MKFYTQYDRPEKHTEKNDGPIITEQAHIRMNDLIEEMMNAGERLRDARKNRYDFEHGETVDETFSDPTRNPGFDPSDADEMLQGIAGRGRTETEEPQSDPVEETPEETGEENPENVSEKPETPPETKSKTKPKKQA